MQIYLIMARAHFDFQVVVKGGVGNQERFQEVIAIGPAAPDVQAEVDFCWASIVIATHKRRARLRRYWYSGTKKDVPKSMGR